MSKLSKTVRKIARAHRTAPLPAATPANRRMAAVRQIVDERPVLVFGVGTVVLGALLRRPLMMRNGARMLASEVLVTTIKAGLQHSLLAPPAPSAAPAPPPHATPSTARAAVPPAPRSATSPRRTKFSLFDAVAGAALGFVAERVARSIIRAAEPALVRLYNRTSNRTRRVRS